MLLLTDLTDRELDPLGLPGGGTNVKRGLRESERTVQAWLGAALPLPAGVGAHRSPATDAAGWQALVMVDAAPASQYDALLHAVRQQPPPGPVAAVALTGRRFHGNRGRPWRAVRGNLHLSVAAPLDLPVAAARGLPAVAAVAVCDALSTCAPSLRPRIKWVNDVLLGDAKVAGVLAAVQTRGDRLVAATLGVGLNVARAPAVPPTVFVPRVTCLRDAPGGGAVRLGDALAAVLAALGVRLEQLAGDGPSAVVAAYRARCGDIGRHVAIWPEGLPDARDAGELPPPPVAGEVLALDDDLALHVHGAPAPVHGGRLAYWPPDPATGPGAAGPGGRPAE
jgi:BirA family biotin operon repressor/biotin-[acetyl-CoA-carboxylase] ligase